MTNQKKTCTKSSKNVFFCAPAPDRQKSSQNDLPAHPPGGGESTKNEPQSRQEGPKTAPRAPQDGGRRRPTTNFFLSKTVSKPTWRPRGPKRPPEGHFGPPGGRKSTPGGSFLASPQRRFSKPPEAHFRRRWRNTCPTSSSTPGPAECAKRLNNQKKLEFQKIKKSKNNLKKQKHD